MLDATIEAARVAEVGKGFALMTNEVKELTKETATEEISQRTEVTRADPKSVITVIAKISTVIDQINDCQNTMTSAVEQETASANPDQPQTAQPGKGGREIGQNIAGGPVSARSTTLHCHGQVLGRGIVFENGC